jgi:RHS repeat-associated protein
VALPTGDTISYVLDAANRRIGRRLNGTLTQGWLYQSQLAPVAELDGSGAVVSRFIYATHVNVPDYMLKGGQTYRLVLDHLGSVRLVVNTSDGTVAQRLDYDEYGRVTQNTSPGFQPFGHAGGLVDDATGLTRFGARDYDPVTGRWTAKDPMGFAAGDGNLYT